MVEANRLRRLHRERIRILRMEARVKGNYAVALDSTVEALQKRAYERGLRDGARKLFTRAERKALREAATIFLAGESDWTNAQWKALESAVEKL